MGHGARHDGHASRMGYVVTPVPKCEGPGAPGSFGAGVVERLVSNRSGGFPQKRGFPTGGRICNCAGGLLFWGSCNQAATVVMVCRLQVGVVCATLEKLQFEL